MIQDTQNAQISLTHNGSKIYIYIYATMKTMFPQDFRNRGSVEILTLVHVLYGYKVMYQKCLTSNMAAMYQQFVTVHHVCKCMSCQLFIHHSFYANLSYPIVAVALIVSLWTVNCIGGA